MSSPKVFMAASVPRFLRQTRLGHLPLNNIIGSRITQGDGGANLVFDVVMVPVNEFQRIKNGVGLQHIAAPALKAGPAFMPSFMLTDAKKVVVPASEPDPEAFARHYFLKEFRLLQPDVIEIKAPAADMPLLELWRHAMSKCTQRNIQTS